MTNEELKTPSDWCALLGAEIMDHDGWRDGTRSWYDPITREEFDKRLMRCTINMRKYPQFI